ncbi:oligosaccharide flippase family protein [archaeon]|jgi:O-antigen/teichoic acid export membrane protein|nr:oligosaccharide flippase family protein [archaeon]MBT4352625.1 oligosaccharide flippase family protein [archaeon]MBT6182295.1 oligosaccharide flippase family protein [archaeon]MBT6606093.1 oligosaccharide flippase family protein [archaeon]MBT7660984.1 oligosaccharide flippase family protein [archaeon]
MATNLNELKEDLNNVFLRFRKKDFSGNQGALIKNSTWNLISIFGGKVGSFIFTIVLARMLMPELFGLYSLALSTILFFTIFSELGIGTSMLTYVSKSLGKNDPKKAKSYYNYLLKYKLYLVLFSVLLLAILSNFIANSYYDKPIFYALLSGIIFLPAISLQSYLSSAFHAENNYKYTAYKEILFQVIRLILIPLSILYVLRFSVSIIILWIILLTAISHLIVLFFLKISSNREIKFLREKYPRELNSAEKNDLRKFILPLSLLAFSGLFFGYIDTIMLGHYVEGTYLGYYGAAFSLLGSAAAILGFFPGALLPIFSRMGGKSLKKTFRKTRNWLILISISASVFTFVTSKYILMIYGAEYFPAVNILRILSILLIILPLANIYDTYLISRKRTKVIAALLIFSTTINIFLNWFFITRGLKIGMMEAILGAAIATIISRVIYLIGIMFAKKRVSGNF